jgi:hypothetical protein
MSRFYAKQPSYVAELNELYETDIPNAVRLTTGTLDIDRVITITPVGTVYLQGDRTWAEIEIPPPPPDFQPFFLV